MGSGISRLSPLASCGPYGRKRSDLHDQDGNHSTRKLIPKNNNDDEHIDFDKKKISASSTLPVVVNIVKEKEEKKEIDKVDVINNNDQEEMEEGGIDSDYDSPIFMKSPSFRDFVRPAPPHHCDHDNLKKDGIKEEENKKTETKPDNVSTDEVWRREEKKGEKPEVNKESGGREKKIYKIFSAGGGMKNLFNVNCYHPKSSTSSSSSS